MTSCVVPFDIVAVAVSCDVWPTAGAVPEIVTAVTVSAGGGFVVGDVVDSPLQADDNVVAATRTKTARRMSNPEPHNYLQSAIRVNRYPGNAQYVSTTEPSAEV